MKVNKTKNRFQTGFQQQKSGLQKTSINIPKYNHIQIRSILHSSLSSIHFPQLHVNYEKGWLWAHQQGMISLLSCVPCWWPTLPNFTFPSSLSSLAVTGLGAPLSSSVLKRRYISLQNEWMNEWMKPKLIFTQQWRADLDQVSFLAWNLDDYRA